MNCKEVVELIQRYVDLDLTEAEEHAMLSHLKDCPECAEFFERMKLLSNELESLPRVTPPYSIVDSVLPRIFPEESAAMESEAGWNPTVQRRERNKLPQSKQRKKRGWISWSSVLGGMAAGLILGMFVFKHDVVMLQQRAEDLLLPNRSDKASDASAAGSKDSEKDKHKSGSSQPGKGAPKGAVNGGKSEASAQPGLGGETPNMAQTSPSLETAGPGLTDTVAEPTPSGGQRAVEPSNSMKVPFSSGKREDAQTSASPESAPDLSSKSTAGPTPDNPAKDAPSAAPKAAGSPAPTSSGDDSAFKIRTFDSNTDPAPSSAPVAFVSPSGLFTAVIQDQTVVITDKSGNEVFRSPVRWKDDDTIQLVSWNGDGKLAYKVKSADGTETSYTIDTEAKAETKN